MKCKSCSMFYPSYSRNNKTDNGCLICKIKKPPSIEAKNKDLFTKWEFLEKKWLNFAINILVFNGFKLDGYHLTNGICNINLYKFSEKLYNIKVADIIIEFMRISNRNKLVSK